MVDDASTPLCRESLDGGDAFHQVPQQKQRRQQSIVSRQEWRMPGKQGRFVKGNKKTRP